MVCVHFTLLYMYREYIWFLLKVYTWCVLNNIIKHNVICALIICWHVNAVFEIHFLYILNVHVNTSWISSWTKVWHYINRGCCGRDRMVVGFTTTYAISAYHHWCCEFESRSGRGVQHYVIMFVSDLRQVGGFLRVLRIPPPIKLTATI